MSVSASLDMVRVLFYTSTDGKAKEHMVDVPLHFVTKAGWLEACPPSARDVIEEAMAGTTNIDIIRSGRLDIVLNRDAQMHFLLHTILCASYDNSLLSDDAKKEHRAQHVEELLRFFTAGTAATKISNQMYAYAEMLGRSRAVPNILDLCPASHFKEAKAALMQSPQLRRALFDAVLLSAVPLEEATKKTIAALEEATTALQAIEAELEKEEPRKTNLKKRHSSTQDNPNLKTLRAQKAQHLANLKPLRARKLNATTIKNMSEEILNENPFISRLNIVYNENGQLYYDYDRHDDSTHPVSALASITRSNKKEEAANDKRVGNRKSASSISYSHLYRPEVNHAKIEEFHQSLYDVDVTRLCSSGPEIVIVWKDHVSWIVSQQVIDQLGWRQHCSWLGRDNEPVLETQERMSQLRLSPLAASGSIESTEDELQHILNEMERKMEDIRAQLAKKRRTPESKEEISEKQPKKSRGGESPTMEPVEYAGRVDEAFRICEELREQVEGEWIRAVLMVLNLRLSQTNNSGRLVFLSSWYGMQSYTASRDTETNDENILNLPIDTCDFLAAPVHINNNHWVLSVLDRKHNIVYGLDSKACVERSAVEQLATFGKASDGWTYKRVDVTLQADDVSCGLFALRYAFYIAATVDWLDNISEQQFNVTHMQQRLLTMRQSWRSTTLEHLNEEGGGGDGSGDGNDVMDIDDNDKKAEEEQKELHHIILDTYLHTDILTQEDADRWLNELDGDIQYLPHKKPQYRGRNLARDEAFYCDIVQNSVVFHQYPGSRRDVWKPWSVKTKELRDVLVQRTQHTTLNSLVANAYRDGRDKISPHCDKPDDIQPGTAIITVSLGCTRTLRLQRKRSKDKPIDVSLPHGSVFILGWETNQKYTHQVLDAEEQTSLCLGLTFRTLASRWLPDKEILIRQAQEGKTEWQVSRWPKDGKKKPLLAYSPRNPTHFVAEDIDAVLAKVQEITRSHSESPGSNADDDEGESEEAGDDDDDDDDEHVTEAAATTDDDDMSVVEQQDLPLPEGNDCASDIDSPIIDPATPSDQPSTSAWRSIVLPMKGKKPYETALTHEGMESLVGGRTRSQEIASMGLLGSMHIHHIDSIKMGQFPNPYCHCYKYRGVSLSGLLDVCVLQFVDANQKTADIPSDITPDNWKEAILAWQPAAAVVGGGESAGHTTA
jgi:alkylated DNA repair dioxygenase AlkB